MTAALRSLLDSIPEDAGAVAGIVLGGYVACWAVMAMWRLGVGYPKR